MGETYEQLVTVLTTKLGVDREEVGPEVTIEDLDMDSLALVEMMDILDAEYAIALEEGEIKKNSSLTAVASVLESHGVNRR